MPTGVFDLVTNKRNSAGYAYDASGNMITEATTRTMTYDAENRMVTFNGGSGTTTYTYDGDGRRVKKVDNGNVTSVYVYDALGRMAAEYSSAAFSGPGGTSYVSQDHLGSTRLVINPDYSVRGRHDYLPFGEEIGTDKGGRNSIPGYGAIEFRQKFTSKERDSESGLDFFLARYFSGPQGRFMQTDPIWVKADRMLDPQRLNLYSYVRNNPLKLTDPTGMDVALRTCRGSATMTQCFNEVLNGLKKADRTHVHLVEGNGKNGFKKGQYGITVDADYKGSAGNFVALQKLANDHSATANIDVLNPTDSFNVRVSVSYDTKKGYGNLTSMSMTPGDARNPKENSFGGYTFFPPGKYSPEPFSADDMTDVVINNSFSDVTGSIHHELRHVLLGDFGRMGSNAKHGLPEVDKQTKEAEDEAKQNEKEH